MTIPHLGWFLVILLAVAIVLSLRPDEQELRVEAIPAAACDPKLYHPCRNLKCGSKQARIA